MLRFDGKGWRHYSPEADGVCDLATGFVEWPEGTLWVGTRDGMSRLDLTAPPEAQRWWHKTDFDTGPVKIGGFVRGGFLVTDDTLWFTLVLSTSLGIGRYDGKMWRTYSEVDGLASNRVHRMLRASDGTIWALGEGGLSRFDGVHWVHYTAENGPAWKGNQPGGQVFRQARDGSFWVDDLDQIVHFRYRPSGAEPETFIEPAVDRVSSAGNILLRWSGRDLWDRTPPDKMRYQWRLDPGNWSSWSDRSDFTFTSLSSGRHRFEVRALNQDGNFDPTPAVYAFVVEAPWWRNPYVLGLGIALLGLMGVQSGRIIRRDRRLQETNTALSEANKDLFQANRELQRERAAERIRGQVQAMEQASDFEKVLSVLADDLKAVGLSFETCGIDVLSEPVDEPTMAYFEEHGFHYTTYTIHPEGSVTHKSYHVSAPFPEVIQETLERFVAGEPWQALIGANAIVEVPAAGYGRLRITESDRERFTQENIEALQEFASAIALGYARYLDFRQIQVQTERKSAFLASMSHELRTPMNAIIGFTRMVLRRKSENLTERQKDNLTKVTHSADHLLNLINDILDLSKIEAGRMEVQVEPFDVKKLIAACCAAVDPLVKPGVALKHEVADNLGKATTDQGRLRQIVINLLSNALKFTDSGEVALRTSKANEHLMIAVSDTGTGIPADALEAIFEEFQQVKGSDPQHKGTGLGLPITKGFAELLGGTISVQSEVGKGSTFTVRVPVVYKEGS